ncbi:MAG: phosphoglucosamine mutase [Clostridia bacterium]|nr:phosphoglucosamine mutase [Clostridia bacterium]
MPIKATLKRIRVTLQTLARELDLSRPTLDRYIALFDEGKTIPSTLYQCIFESLFLREIPDAEEFERRLSHVRQSFLLYASEKENVRPKKANKNKTAVRAEHTGKYFGTDGFRGQAGVGLTAEHAFLIGRYLGWYYTARRGERARIVIGKDTRRSSYMYENALAAGITSSGADAYLLHVTTTPCVSYITRTEKFDCGVMISASHNPYYDNGIKLMNETGEKADDDLQDAIERYIDGDPATLPFAVGEEIGCTVDFYSGRNRYIGYLTSLATRSFENMRVGLDCANGSSWMLARALFDALGAKTVVICDHPDGLNINEGCGSTHIERLQKTVREQHLDAGFAFDGDADRCIAVDERGEEINGDKILYICAKHMKAQGQLPSNTVVATVMSNMGLFKALEREGIGYEKTTVGDRYVYENMKENDHMIGGEQSGHVIFRKYAHTGDGLLTAVMLVSVMKDTQLPLSTLAKGVTMYPQVLKNVSVRDKEAAVSDPSVQATLNRLLEELGDDGRVLLRKSGTEPVLRVMAEASTLERCEAAVEDMIGALRGSGHLIEIK